MTNQIQVDLGSENCRPIFADEVVVMTMLKQRKEDTKLQKEGTVGLVFVDTPAKKALGRIILSRLTAKGLAQALNQSLAKMDSDVEGAQEIKIETTSSQNIDPGYIG